MMEGAVVGIYLCDLKLESVSTLMFSLEKFILYASLLKLNQPAELSSCDE